MAKARLYEFVTGIEASAQPDAGTPTLPNDLVTLGYLGTMVQEEPTGTINGSNVTFTLAHTPVRAAEVMVFQNGLFMKQGVGKDYTISGATITFTTAPATGQVLDVVYKY